MDDDALVRQTLAGESQAYAELVSRWAARVVALCHARAGRADLAEGLAEETLLRGFEELPCLADPSRFGPWLLEIADHACRDSLDLANPTDPPREAPNGTAGGLLAEAEALPDECRAVLMLFYSEKATYRDVARLLSEPTAAVGSRLARARMLLRERLTPADEQTP